MTVFPKPKRPGISTEPLLKGIHSLPESIRNVMFLFALCSHSTADITAILISDIVVNINQSVALETLTNIDGLLERVHA